MNDDQTLRTILLVCFLVVFPIAVYYRLKSQATGEKLDRRQEGLFMLATLRPAGLAFWLGIIAYMVNPSWMGWSSVPLPLWLRWTGVGIFALAGGLLFWTFRSLGSNLTDTVVTRMEHTLVTARPVSLGPPSVLRLRGLVGRRDLPGCVQLVPVVDRRAGPCSAGRQNANGRREAACPLWRRLSKVYGADRPFSAEPRMTRRVSGVGSSEA